jgi:tRNA-splicing ligase RtcB
MKKVIATEAKPIKMWLDDLEETALAQAKNLANLTFTFKHVALMPDCHAGYGMPIGGVLATKGVVIPNAVGVDIGCGMCAVKTSLPSIDKDSLSRIVDLIKGIIPVGFNHQKEAQQIPPFAWNEAFPPSVVLTEYDSARYQLGTLGGGNHFIEVQRDHQGFIWIMIHSGSRNLGKKVADHYNKIAVGLNELWHSKVEKSAELAFLPINTIEGKAYLEEMKYCVEFALANRSFMMEKIKDCFRAVLPETTFFEAINIAHNYAAFENHFGENVIVHRKGATFAGLKTPGIIPGSQGTKSYITYGLGNPESFFSCSHGAGRRMGRKEAQRTLDLEAEKKLLDDQGIIHGIKEVSDLDEAASAYKDINLVMENQKDLVTGIVELTPLAVIKG